MNPLVFGRPIAVAWLAATIPSIGNATQVDFTGISIEQVRVFNVAYGAYHAGDWEMVITFPNSAPPPAALNCPERLLITTRGANDPERRLLERAKEVQYRSGSTASITVSDDPNRQAIAGRCSLIAIKY